MPDDLDVQSLLDRVDPAVRPVLVAILNHVEALTAENQALRETVRRLEDEVRRLKGEHPAPQRSAAKSPPGDRSSEKERRQPRPRNRGKRPPIRIDRTAKLRVDRSGLPPDARFKGWVKTVVQEVVLVRQNTCFLREKFYSPSTGRTYLAELPPGYEGGFGPGTKTLALGLCYGANVSFAQVKAFLRDAGLRISIGRVASLLTRGLERFHAEADEVLRAGLASSTAHGIDTTPTGVAGKTWHAHALCNPFYTVYHTTPTKERLAALAALQGGRPVQFRLNALTLEGLAESDVGRKHRLALEALPWEVSLDAASFQELLDRHLPTAPADVRKRIAEAAALSAYRSQREVPFPQVLVCDDAPQWRRLAELALCWIHDGRHYKLLSPSLTYHRQLLEQFRERYWKYYHQLAAYAQDPNPEQAAALSDEFDALFGTMTGYALLDDRIAKTKRKKADLLRVLLDPTVPLHNNAAELAARRRVRKRDASLAARTPEGVRVWDTFQGLAETTAKLGVSYLEYLRDRIEQAGHVPRLAELIAARSDVAQRLRCAA